MLLRLLLLLKQQKEIGVVASPSCLVGMLRSQLLLTDGQGPLVEGVSLSILCTLSFDSINGSYAGLLMVDESSCIG